MFCYFFFFFLKKKGSSVAKLYLWNRGIKTNFQCDQLAI